MRSFDGNTIYALKWLLDIKYYRASLLYASSLIFINPNFLTFDNDQSKQADFDAYTNMNSTSNSNIKFHEILFFWAVKKLFGYSFQYTMQARKNGNWLEGSKDPFFQACIVFLEVTFSIEIRSPWTMEIRSLSPLNG